MKYSLKHYSLGMFVIAFFAFLAFKPAEMWQPPHHDDTMIGIGTDDDVLGVNTDTIHLAPVYSVRLNQASTSAPTAYVFNNQYTGTAPVWTRDSIGTYKLTKTDAFLDSTLIFQVTIGSGTAFVAKMYRQSDSTCILRHLAKTGIGADLSGTESVEIWRYID